MKMRRRMLLKGAGGVCLTLPFLEGLAPKHAAASDDGVDPFAIFFRQANGVGAAQNTELGSEPERFWPHQLGQLTPENVAGRAMDELSDHLDRLLIVRNVNMENFNYGDGHARGAMQGLTARGPTVEAAGGSSEAAGESVDHYIGRHLNPDGRDSLFLYAGRNNGWLGGACISYRSAGQRRAPLHNPVTAYMTMMGVDSAQFEMLAARRQSINDVVRDQMTTLMARPELSQADRDRLDLHFQSIRDLEDALMCNLSDEEEAALDGVDAGYDSDNGNLVLQATRVHMDIAALAVACGYTRSVAIQVGNGNDGSTRYEDPDTGTLMENFHYISHRRMSHDSSGTVIAGSDILHHKVDRHFARTFNHLLNKLHEYVMPTGQRLIDCGVAVWYNDNGNGPGHSANNIPYVLAGSANGLLRQGVYIEASGGNEKNHRKMLNTIATAAGVRKDNGDFVDDFGDPGLPAGVLDEMFA
jgi:hypothetical protein